MEDRKKSKKKLSKAEKLESKLQKKIEKQKNRKARKKFVTKSIALLLIIAVGVVVIINYLEIEITNHHSKDLKKIQDDKNPYVLIVNNEDTPVGKRENELIKDVIKKNEGDIPIIYIKYNGKDMEEKNRFIDEYNISTLPTIITIDKLNNPIEKFEAPLKRSDVEKSIDALKPQVK